MAKVRAVVLVLLVMSAVGVATASSAYAGAVWVVNGVTLKTSETSSVAVGFGPLLLKWEDITSGTRFEGECKKTSGKEELKGGNPGKGKVQSLMFKECALIKGETGCKITIGGWTAEGLPGWPTELEDDRGEIFDLTTAITFSLILEGCEKISFNKTWLFKGNLNAEVHNGTEKVKLGYPTVAIEGGTLESEGAKARLSGEAELEKEGGTLQVGEEVSPGHKWLKNGSELFKEEPVLSEGGLFALNAAGKEVACKKLKDVADISPGTKGLVLDLHFLECVTTVSTCFVHSPGAANGLILVGDIPDELTLAETSGGVKVLADEFKESPTSKEFVKLEFEPESACKTPGYVNTKVKGHVDGEVSGELITFPKPELKGNTLEAFGSAASLFGDDKQMFTLGGTLSAI
jgi:hypothetical protein